MSRPVTRCRNCGSEIRFGITAYNERDGSTQVMFSDWWHFWSGSVYCGPSGTTKAAP